MEYLTSIVNNKKGRMPDSNEYGFLKGRGCVEFELSSKQEHAVYRLLSELGKNPFYVLSEEDIAKVKEARRANAATKLRISA